MPPAFQSVNRAICRVNQATAAGVRSWRQSSAGRPDRTCHTVAVNAVKQSAALTSATGHSLDGRPEKGHRTVTRVITVLEVVAADPHGVRLSVLAGILEAPKSSVFSLVKGLVATGYLLEDNGLYTLGPAVGALLAPSRPTLAESARPAMEELRSEFNETVMLAIAVANSVVYVATVESTQFIRYSAPLRRRRPLYPTSSGKCLLAFMSERRRLSYLAEHIADPEARAAAAAELVEVAEKRVAYNRGETIPDVTAVASIIQSARGRSLASLAMAGPTSRMAGKLEDAATAVRLAAIAVSQRL